MPESLLSGQKPLASAMDNLERLEEQAEVYDRLLRVFVREVRRLVEDAIHSVEELEAVWQDRVKEVAQGQMARVHAQRENLLAELQLRLDRLKRSHRLATGLRKWGEEAPDPDILLPIIARLERLKTRVFDRWQTIEDLEDLAARDYALTTADLDRIGPERRPPASWYAEEGKPF
jgi:hypothetical protein